MGTDELASHGKLTTAKSITIFVLFVVQKLVRFSSVTHPTEATIIE
ncbi:MAG: hypothetical protein GY906_29555 [bacterium]|nr:hypothetical protein [bacterium]